MKYYFSILTICTLAACGGSGGAPSPGLTTPPPSGPTAPSTPVDSSFNGMLNDVRLANSAAPVAFDSRLGQAAQSHANDMLAQNYFSHTGRNGSTVGSRVTATGYQWRIVGENIAQGYTSEESVLQGWTNSPGHHANNINPEFEDFGLAKAGSGSDTRWVLVLASER